LPFTADDELKPLLLHTLLTSGYDVALVRATIVDAEGNVCSDASVAVTFSVASGPGLIWGTSSGNPTDQVPTLSSRTTYHGLVRAVVRVTVDAAGDASDRAMLAFVNPDAGVGPFSSSVFQGTGPAPSSIVVEARAAGFQTATIVVALSTDPSDAVLAVAAASIAAADVGE
jgi:hypothetical protein